MRVLRVLTGVLLSGLIAPSLRAQAPDTTLTPRTVLGGITLRLPTGWRPPAAAQRTATQQRVNAALARSTDSTLRAALAIGKPAILLQETLPGAFDPSANVNAAPTPGIATAAFDGYTAPNIEAAMGDLCKLLTDFLAQSGGRMIRCDPLTLDQVEGHTISVRRILRAGSRGNVAVWIAQYPDKDMMYTLTLTAPETSAGSYEALYRTIIRSVRIPAWSRKK